ERGRLDTAPALAEPLDRDRADVFDLDEASPGDATLRWIDPHVRGDAPVTGGQRQDDNQPGRPLVEQVRRDNKGRALTPLLVSANRVKINEPHLAASGCGRHLGAFLAVGEHAVPGSALLELGLPLARIVPQPGKGIVRRSEEMLATEHLSAARDQGANGLPQLMREFAQLLVGRVRNADRRAGHTHPYPRSGINRTNARVSSR